MSGSKTASLLDLAAKVDDGTVRLDRIGRLSDDDIVRHLIAVRGIGPWTAEMFLIFTLHRLDVWPIGDYGVRVGYAKAYGLPEVPTSRELAPLGDRFRPYRTYAAWYCWRVAGTEQPT
jgi:DNA-3-methyladenine glycosylase II